MNEEMGPLQEILEEAELEMMEALEACERELKGVRTGRASAGLVDHILVESYGAKMPMKQVATITVPEPRLIVIQVWDKNNVRGVEKAILQSDLGLSPMSDGQVVRLPIPPLTEDRRKELVKMVKRIAEEARISVRNARRSANEKCRELEKNHDISEDDRFRSEKKIQEMTDERIEKIDELLSKKEEELMDV